jgi:hypothetical protein
MVRGCFITLFLVWAAELHASVLRCLHSHVLLPPPLLLSLLLLLQVLGHPAGHCLDAERGDAAAAAAAACSAAGRGGAGCASILTGRRGWP